MGEDGAGRTELQVKECRRTGWYTHVGVTSAGVQRAAVSARDKQYPSASPVQAPTAPAWQPGCPSRGPGLPSTRAGPAAQAAPPAQQVGGVGVGLAQQVRLMLAGRKAHTSCLPGQRLPAQDPGDPSSDDGQPRTPASCLPPPSHSHPAMPPPSSCPPAATPGIHSLHCCSCSLTTRCKYLQAKYLQAAHL